MIDDVWTVLCSKVVTDQATQEFSLVDIIEGIDILAEPPGEMNLLPAEYVLVSYWVRSRQARTTTTSDALFWCWKRPMAVC